MNTPKKLVLLLAVFQVISSKAQVPCTPSNSPTFDLITNTVTPAVNGFCHAELNIVNAMGTGGGAVSFCITGPAPNSPSCMQPPVIAMVTGIWTVQVMDNVTACVTSQTVQINSLPAPSVSVAASNTVVCAWHTVILTASGANTYKWNTNATTASISVTPYINSTYSVTGTGSNGCSNTSTFAINVNPLPTLTLTASQNPVCTNETADITAQGATTYTWNTFETGGSISITPASNTMYSVSGTDGNGCQSGTQILVSVSPCTSVEGFKLPTEDFRIFPNPADYFIELKITDIELLKELKTILIYDHLGRKILEETLPLPQVQGSAFENILKIRSEEFEPGVYYLQLKSNRSGTVSQRFIISR